MSRYLALILLALSASVLAAPAEVRQLPALPETPTAPVLGERSNSKTYSPGTLHKRDYLYPSSTQDCRLSEVPEGSPAHAYTHGGQTYSEECLTQLALSVPSERRESCRTAGVHAHGYHEECLFRKAFDEDWKFDMEKAKKDELAYRDAHSGAASEAWPRLFPSAISDCRVSKEKAFEGGRNGWTRYSITPDGLILDDECVVRVLIAAKVTIGVETCSARETTDVIDIAADITADITAHVPLLDINVDAVVSLMAALRTGCLTGVVVELVAALGVEALIAVGPLRVAADVVAEIAAGPLRGAAEVVAGIVAIV